MEKHKKIEIFKQRVSDVISQVDKLNLEEHSLVVYTQILPLIEINALGYKDNCNTIDALAKKILKLSDAVAISSISVFPMSIDTAGLLLKDNNISISAVIGGYPMSDTYPEVKILECAMAVENGADEIEMCLNMREVVTGDVQIAVGEVDMMKKEIDSEALLKVIIDISGIKKDEQQLIDAYIGVMDAGADFICVDGDDVSLYDAAILLETVRDYYLINKRKVGVSYRGTIDSFGTLFKYYYMVRILMSQEWFDEELIRVDATSQIDYIQEKISKYI